MVNDRALQLDLAEEAGLSVERFPKTQEEANIAADAIAKQLDELSLQDHEKALFDLHGIAGEFDADETTIQKALRELELEINKIEDKEEYDEACFLNEHYVTNREFRLMFLRCFHFDVLTAAKTIVFHFKVKRRLFGGGNILARDILQSDLSPEALESLAAGAHQVLPSRDASGRLIVFIGMESKSNELSLSAILPASWYLNMTLARHEDVQKKGYVLISMSHSEEFAFGMDFYEEVNEVDMAIPFRCVSFHCCYTNADCHRLATGLQLFASEQDRSRTRLHYGTPDEIAFELQTFGIPVDCIPLEQGSSLQTNSHLAWIQSQKVIEMSYDSDSSNKENIIIPRNQDVLFGKLPLARGHIGNTRAHYLVESYYQEYEKANKTEKTALGNKVIAVVHALGGRFLRSKGSLSGGAWEEVSDTIARQKIAHWFRHLREKKAKSHVIHPKTSATKRQVEESH